MPPSDPRWPSAGRVREARVAIVGVGGLGCPAALALAAAGVGTLVLVDGDVVEPSNLPRQILYGDADLGQPKVEVAAARLAERFAGTQVVGIPDHLTRATAALHLAGCDVVLDGTDQAETKYLLNDVAIAAGITLVHAGVVGLHGQILTILPGRTACLRCLFPVEPTEGEVPTCQEAGVLGPVAGTIASVQAAEALRYLLGLPAGGRLLTYDAARERWRAIAVARQPACRCAKAQSAPQRSH